MQAKDAEEETRERSNQGDDENQDPQVRTVGTSRQAARSSQPSQVPVAPLGPTNMPPDSPTRLCQSPESSLIMSPGAIERGNEDIRNLYPFDDTPGLPPGFARSLESALTYMTQDESHIDPIDQAMFQFYSRQHRLSLRRENNYRADYGREMDFEMYDAEGSSYAWWRRK